MRTPWGFIPGLFHNGCVFRLTDKCQSHPMAVGG